MDDSILMTFDELSQSLGARCVGCKGEGFSSVTIDSRNLKPGALFVALAGAAHDGHSFAEAAFRAGAAGVMAARSRLESHNLAALAEKWGKALVIVDDTLKGLQNAARVYLEKFPRLLKIAITGSSGKTTTKEIAAAISSVEKKTVMNSGNLNSETGLPLSVFNVRGEHEVGIFEAGMNRRGEIAELADVLKPNIALITNIGSAHIGILGSKQAIAEEKKAVFSQFTGSQTALIPADDEYRDFLAEGVSGKIIFYGEKLFPELEGVFDRGLDGSDINWAGKAARFPLPGAVNLKNAFAAIAVAREIPVGADAVRHGLEAIKPLFGRGEILKGTVTLIRDCYNSNPESLEAALAFCDSLDWPGRKVYVAGSMLELGGISKEAHRGMGQNLSASNADFVFLYGVETEAAADILSGGKKAFFHTNNMDKLKDEVSAYIRNGDLVLLKGSRGCALEELTPVISGVTVPEGGV